MTLTDTMTDDIVYDDQPKTLSKLLNRTSMKKIKKPLFKEKEQ